MYKSPDGTRKVVVSGESQMAYLYDTAYVPAFDPVYLGSGVNDVQFQLDDQGQLDGIVTVLDDGALNMFDQNGKPTGQIVYSPDRTRRVDISGDDRDAYLNDTADSPAFDPVFLGAKVLAVQFQSDELGRLVVLVLNEDGSTNSYNSYGTLIDSQPAPQAASATDDQAGASAASSVGQGLEKSALFNALKTGNISW
ncbi:MAG: hypothetical protein NTY77_09145 [Elusimicrobia bacterium]|nr:hypothetical protein [Elusimicrobiota bacterium]